MYGYILVKKGKKKERSCNFSQFSCPQCSYLSETVLKCTTHSNEIFLAGVEGLEPSQTVLETGVLPLTPYPYKKEWWTSRDSNPGPTGYEPVALTN